MRLADITLEFFEAEFIEEYMIAGITRSLDKFNITRHTFNKFISQNQRAAEMLANAKAMRADAMVDEILDIADNDIDPQRARNRIGARQWIASRFKPAEYGDAQTVKIEPVDMRNVLERAKAMAFIKVPKVLSPPMAAEEIEEMK